MDAYDRKARLYPAAYVVAPATLLALLLFSVPQWWTGLVGFLAAGGLHALVVNIVRDLGTRMQPQLWSSWGGTPTTVKLRWSTAGNKLIHGRRHADVAAATGIALPSETEEAADPSTADATYDAAVHILRERTRSASDFPHVMAELTNYGFRRNLYACRPYGVILAALVLIAEIALAVLGWKGRVDVPFPLMATSAVITLAWIVVWIAIVTPVFVRRAADRYADALISSASSIAT